MSYYIYILLPFYNNKTKRTENFNFLLPNNLPNYLTFYSFSFVFLFFISLSVFFKELSRSNISDSKKIKEFNDKKSKTYF